MSLCSKEHLLLRTDLEWPWIQVQGQKTIGSIDFH